MNIPVLIAEDQTVVPRCLDPYIKSVLFIPSNKSASRPEPAPSTVVSAARIEEEVVVTADGCKGTKFKLEPKNAGYYNWHGVVSLNTMTNATECI